jgi:cytoskeletal protein CcmA (bactofilin family)
MTFNNEDVSINSIIGVGSTISGDIKVNGFVRIDGDIDGNLETTGNIIIGEKARIQGNIVARSVTVGGIVRGNITASDSIALLSTSVVLGDILTRHITADENVVFNGHCIALSNEDAYNAAVITWQNLKTITSHSILQSVHVPHEDTFMPSPKQDEKNNAFVEETVQDITIAQDAASVDSDEISDEAIPSETTPSEKQAQAQAKPAFVPINLGEKYYTSSSDKNNSSDNSKV